MLKNISSFLLLLPLCMQISFAQNLPSYKITVLDTSSEGYYFLGIVNANNGPNLMYPMILDAKGRMVYYASANTGDFKLHPNGLISFFKQQRIYLIDSTFTVVDTVFFKNGIMPDGHDFQILPNGHFLLLGTENVTMDLSAYNMFNHNGSPGDANAVVRCGIIQEQDANKNVVFEWHAKNYFAFDDADSANLNSPAIVDWQHLNAVEQDTDGNLLVSMRHFNEIVKVNHSDSSVMWRLGGKRNQFNFTNDPGMFITQHDCRRLANGNITLFDNGDNKPPFHPAAAKEYEIDEAAHTATLVWSYVQKPTSFSRAMGNAQRLANGNTVICHGMIQNDSATFTVVKPSGSKIFEVAFTTLPYSYRAFNFPSLPWQLHRPHISCFDSSGLHYLDAGSGYTSYLWSTGATTQTIAVTSADSFFVFVPAGNTGFIGSEYLFVTNASAPCGLPSSSTDEAANEPDVSIFPNPSNQRLSIQSASFTDESLTIEIFDFTGRRVYLTNVTPYEHTVTLPVADLAKGFYSIRLGEWSRKFVKEE